MKDCTVFTTALFGKHSYSQQALSSWGGGDPPIRKLLGLVSYLLTVGWNRRVASTNAPFPRLGCYPQVTKCVEYTGCGKVVFDREAGLENVKYIELSQNDQLDAVHYNSVTSYSYTKS
jgi:hypothetical protein